MDWSSGPRCDTVGRGYLPGHMAVGAGPQQVPWSWRSGDYCSYWGVPDIGHPSSNRYSPLTGYAPPRPRAAYQVSAPTGGSACQAKGRTWGTYVEASPGRAACYQQIWPSCGVMHSVSFGSEGTTLRPWSERFGGDPWLVIQATGYVAGYGYRCDSAVGCGAAWAYTCVRLQDASKSQPATLELCLRKWATLGWQASHTLAGGDYAGHPYGFGLTDFDNSDTAALCPGSARATVGRAAVRHHYRYCVTITPQHLKKDVADVNAEIDARHLLWAHFSTDPRDYALVGLEDGIEMWGGMTSLGGYTDGLAAWTLY